MSITPSCLLQRDIELLALSTALSIMPARGAPLRCIDFVCLAVAQLLQEKRECSCPCSPYLVTQALPWGA